jgi:hypothetical protein
VGILDRRVTGARVPGAISATIARVLDKGGRGAPLNLPGAGQYVAQSGSVPGWFVPTDLRLFDFILGRQLAESVTGDILEIGSFEGKSTILIGYGLRRDEVLVVCDLFGADPDELRVPKEGMGAYDGLTVDSFHRNYGRFHARRPQVEVCPSSELAGRIQGRRFRFLHIDGSHAYEAVKGDISMALDFATEDAVVVLDDFRSPHTPGVAAAVWEGVAAGLIYPFGISEMKLYAAVSEHGHKRWSNACAQLGAQPRWESEVHLVHDRELVRLGFVSRRGLGF